MKLNFCTLFNSSYLSRGLVMYDSLLKNCPDFHLYVFAFDDICYRYLVGECLEHLTVISLKEFEDQKLLSVKPSRSATEYCWTCTPSVILYSISRFGLDHCTYIDADLYFYSNPSVLIDEMGEDSVLITEHRYTQEYNQTDDSGKYCVQFITFKDDSVGLKVLNWWRNACLEWCYSRHEDGKFGDQKYLDDWIFRFSGVRVLAHLGGGVAPWNVQQYEFFEAGTHLKGIEKKSGKLFDVVFFHFHAVIFYKNNIVSYSNYQKSDTVIKLFYSEYIRLLNAKKKVINNKDSSFDANGAYSKAPYSEKNLSLTLKLYIQDLKTALLLILGRNVKKTLSQHYYYKIK